MLINKDKAIDIILGKVQKEVDKPVISVNGLQSCLRHEAEASDIYHAERLTEKRKAHQKNANRRGHIQSRNVRLFHLSFNHNLFL